MNKHTVIGSVLGTALLAAGASVAAAECPIRIGGLAPLSAPGAVTGGEAMRDAMSIAVEEINEEGGLLGCQVELVVVDTEGLPERGTAVAEKLINQDRVAAIAGGYHSSVGIGVKEVAHRYGVPVVFAETWSDQITAAKLPEVFRIAPLSSEASAVLGRFAGTVPRVDKVAIVTENTDYGIPAAQETAAVLEEEGLEHVTFSVDIGTQDFSGIIQRVKVENPDMIIVLTTGEASYNFQQQAAEAGIGPGDLPMICDQVALESKAFWTNVPDGNYCFVSRIGLPPELYNEVSRSFLERYVARTGKDVAESYAFEAYDSVMIIAEAIKQAGNAEPAKLIDALEGIRYVGALGEITFPYGRDNPPEADGKDAKWWHQFPDPAITMVQYQKPGQDSTEAVVVYPERYKTGDPVWVHM